MRLMRVWSMLIVFVTGLWGLTFTALSLNFTVYLAEE